MIGSVIGGDFFLRDRYCHLESYRLVCGDIYNLRKPIEDGDEWITLDSVSGLMPGDTVELRNEWQSGRSNFPSTYACVVEAISEGKIKLSGDIPHDKYLRSIRGIFILKKTEIIIDNFTLTNDINTIRMDGYSEYVDISIDISKTEDDGFRFYVTRSFKIDTCVLSETILFNNLPPIQEVYRKNRQVDCGVYQRSYCLDKEGALFSDGYDTDIYIYRGMDAASVCLYGPEHKISLSEITPFMPFPHNLQAALEKDPHLYASARGGKEKRVSFFLNLQKETEIRGVFLTWYRCANPDYTVSHMRVYADPSKNGQKVVLYDGPCQRGGALPFDRSVTTDQIELEFTELDGNSFFLSWIDVLISGQDYTLAFNLDDHRDHRLCSYLAPKDRTQSMRQMTMKMRSTIRRISGETIKNYFTIYDCAPKIRPRIMHIPNGAQALFLWTEHADRTTLENHRAVYFGRSDITSPQDAVGGFVFHGIPVTKSIFWSNPRNVTCSPQVSEPQLAVDDSVEFMSLCKKLEELGHEICFHAGHPDSVTAEEMPHIMEKFSSTFKTKTWIDHSSGQLHCNVSGSGLDPSSAYYMIENWNKNGFKYFWQYGSEDSGSQLIGSINILQHRLPDSMHTPLYWQIPSSSGDIFAWPTLKGMNIHIYSEPAISELVECWGVCINHTYPAANYQQEGVGQFLPTNRTEVYLNTDIMEDCLRNIADKKNEGTLIASTISKTMDWWRMCDNVIIRHGGASSADIINRSGRDILGLSFALDMDVDVPAEMTVCQSGASRIVSLDLGASEMVRLEHAVNRVYIRLTNKEGDFMNSTSQDITSDDLSSDVQDVNAMFLVANFTNIRPDSARMFPEGVNQNIVVFDTRTPPKEEGVEYRDLLDMVLDGQRDIKDIVFGPSLSLPFVSELARGLLDRDYHPEGVLSGVSEFIVNNVRRGSGTTSDILEKNEMLYFIFSSSLRSSIFCFILDHYMNGQNISCLIDHGSAIGMIPLYLTHAYKGEITRVGCSEIKKEYVSLGHILWRRCGLGERISWQEVSSSDFVYPEGVSVIIFAQMLYRIPQEQRKALIESAWAALAPGGVLILNEIMNKPFPGHTLLTSDELFSYLPKEVSPRFFWDFRNPKSAPIADVAVSMFSRYDSTVAMQKEECCGQISEPSSDNFTHARPSVLKRILDKIAGLVKG